MSSLWKLVLWVLLALFLNVQSSEGLRILGIFPLHGKSHFVMCGRLMRALAERGHQVDVYGHFPLKKSVPNYTDYSLVGSMPNLANNMTYEFITFVTNQISMAEKLRFGGEQICNLMNLPVFQKLIRDPPKNPPYDLVIVEPFLANCYLAWGRYLNVPLIGVSTTTLFEWLNEPLGNPSNLATEPSVFSKYIVPMTFYERLCNVLLTTYMRWSFSYHVGSQNTIVEKFFGSGHPDVMEMQKDISLMLVNYHFALNGIRPFAPSVVPVGGMHIVDSEEILPGEVQKFLDESKHGFLYCSFGSMARIETFPKPLLDIFYKTFKKIAPVRVLMKIAKPEDLPPGLPSNVITQPWLPQVHVLKHKNIKAFITHGGLMGTQESIYNGVPMIGFPLFGDQHFNIESYVKRNMAIKVDRELITEESFTRDIMEIINNPMYKKSAEITGKAFKDMPMKPIDTAIFWVEYIARHGKNALRGPTVDMPWWQVSLLDVYGFIAIVILAILCVLKTIVKKLFRRSSPKQCRHGKSKLKKN